MTKQQTSEKELRDQHKAQIQQLNQQHRTELDQFKKQIAAEMKKKLSKFSEQSNILQNK